MDVSSSIVPRSDQLNADDLMARPLTVTIKEVTPGTTEQPVNVHLVEFPGRPYKPSKSMRRVLVAAWGLESSAWVGKQLTLYRNPDIMFGGDKVGGIEISHMTGLDGKLSIALTKTRGRRKDFTVQPLEGTDGPVQAWIAAIDRCKSTDELARTWTEVQAARLSSDERLIRSKDHRKAQIQKNGPEA